MQAVPKPGALMAEAWSCLVLHLDSETAGRALYDDLRLHNGSREINISLLSPLPESEKYDFALLWIS